MKRVEHEQRRKDALQLLEIFSHVTKMTPHMWGDSIVGFGEYHYKSERSRQEGVWPLRGFSPRKQNMTVYIMSDFSEYQDLLARLGPHKTTVSCIYFTRLEKIDTKILKQIIRKSVASCKKRGFCPSCGARRMAESAALSVDDVFPCQAVRQWVLSFSPPNPDEEIPL